MRTTLDLPDPVFRDLKATAAKRGIKMKDLLTSFVQAGLYGPQQAVPSRNRSPLPTPRRSMGKKIPALSNAEAQEILDEEDAKD